MPVPKLNPADRPWWGWLGAWKHTNEFLGYFSAAALVGSVVYGFWTRNWPSVTLAKTMTGTGIVKVVVLGSWILLPPVWFWLEYFGVYRYEGGNFDDMDQFKYGQDVSSKIWVAAVTALTILYFGKDFKS